MSTAKKLLLEGVSDAVGFIGGALAGYWLGNVAWVKQNLSLIIVGILIASVIPIGIGYVKSLAV